ncbi:MAG TPA: helix-turn-helix transcriptional regulator [Kofleriaceae bacterium]|nr:helix-turn-helix transcriptional regulator [Kofleriaceae bacterium]
MAGVRIRNHIRALRFAAGEMTQQQLADAVGVTRQTINAIEGGKYSPTLEVAFQIAEALAVSLDRVFEYEPAAKRARKP